jgi:hypothetical protein
MQCYRTSPVGRDVQLRYLSSPLVRGGDHNPAISAHKGQCSHLDTNSVLQVSTRNLTSDGSCDYCAMSKYWTCACFQVSTNKLRRFLWLLNYEIYWTMYLLLLH